MFKVLKVLCTLIATSLFYFPFCFMVLPSVNTKLILGTLGLCLFIYNLGKSSSFIINKDFITLSLFALGVSIASLLSITINSTTDKTYLTYIISMFVWLGAAYFVLQSIQGTHGHISIELVCLYLAGTCVLQCIIAILIDTTPSVKTFVDSFLAGEGFMGKNKNRLYGLGCALDVAGTRFSAILIIIAFVITKVIRKENWKTETIFLLLAFFIISIIGNIIGRTTSVGMVLATCFLIITCISPKIIYENEIRKRLKKTILSVLCVTAIIQIILCTTFPTWKKNMEFGFEGFYSLFETGTWKVHSNDMLKGTFIVPDNMHTWVIGDGYMDTTDNDPYYTGTNWHGFYKMTDVGYSRFLFYFGLFGLIPISAVMIQSILICIKNINGYCAMFILLLILNFIIWFKVSTDIFPAYAILLCLAQKQYELNNTISTSDDTRLSHSPDI